MSEQFREKIERSSFGTAGAKAARRSVSLEKSQSLVARSMSSKQVPGSRTNREGK